jgi:threonine dehydratase
MPDSESNVDLSNVIERVRGARERIRALALRTPLVRLSSEEARPIYMKLENLQPVGSFKIRCGANALLSLSAEERELGVSTASAGNFAQGLAYAARSLHIPVTAVVPDTAAATKIEALEALGADIVRCAYQAWWNLLQNSPTQYRGRKFVHPVNDPAVIAGNGTIGLEILEDLPEVETIIVPYGGGGLAVGIASYVKSIRPGIKVFACETEAGQPVAAAFKAGEPVEVPFNSRTFASGMGSSRVLDCMWPSVRALLEGALCVSLADTAAAIRLLMLKHHIIAEGAAAAPVAAAIQGIAGAGPVVCVVSGGHLNPAHITTILTGNQPSGT